MKTLLESLRTPSTAFDPALEREFRSVYQGPRLRYMQATFAVAAVGFAAFLLMDIIDGMTTATASVSQARAAIVLLFTAGLAASYLARDSVVRHYTVIVNLYSALGMLSAALLPIAVHGHRSSADIYWSINSSLTMAAIVIYGFNRLTSRNTALIVISGCFVGISTVFVLPVFDWYSFSRLILYLVVVNLVALFLRATIERRERQLFLVARDNLSKNVYAKELEVARTQAEEGNEVKMRFLANMSHEFRTPMNGVLQTLELVSRTAAQEVRPLIQQAQESGQALVKTLDTILEYTAWTQAVIAPRRSRLSLSETVREVLNGYRHATHDRNLELVLRLDLASSEDIVLLDGRMFAEALSRLVDNAICFTPGGGRVRVDVELAAHQDLPYPAAELKVAITDTGIGIPAELQEAVFTPFYQVDSASTRAVGGTGLGLAIVRRLCAAMGATLALDSIVGTGTTVRLRIPTEICKPDRARSLGSEFEPPSSIRSRPLAGTVLLVEDNDFNAALVAELLTLMGLNVSRAADGEDAHRQACERSFDLVLMDCQMPKVDGYESTRRIRDSERASGNHRVPIIALTANALSGDRQKCLDAGMDDYLAKPYTAAQLHAKLATWLPERLVASNAAAGAATA